MRHKLRHKISVSHIVHFMRHWFKLAKTVKYTLSGGYAKNPNILWINRIAVART